MITARHELPYPLQMGQAGKSIFLALLYLAVAAIAMSAFMDAITPPPLHKYTDAGYCGAPRVVHPHLAGSVQRTYPPKAVRLNEEGATTLDFRVEKDGTVDDVQIVRSSGFADLDQAAQSGTRTERYYPARLAAKPIACRRLERIVWKLTDDDGNKASNMLSSYINVFNMGRTDYPPQAAANGEQGTTKIEVAIDENGKIIQSQVSQSSGFKDLDLAALNKIFPHRQIASATLSGKPIRTVAMFEFRWSLASQRGEPRTSKH